MSNKWGPSWWGRRLTGAPEWSLVQQGFELSLTVDGQAYSVLTKNEDSYHVRSGLFWTAITFSSGKSDVLNVDGLPNAQRKTLIAALELILSEVRIREKVTFLQGEYKLISEWLREKTTREEEAKTQRRWFTHEAQAALENARPTIDARAFRKHINDSGVQENLGKQALNTLEWSLALWEMDHRPFWGAMNTLHIEHELEACKDLFGMVESKPLTEEQARAVICFDNRVQVVASAGSGKTSTMVAKAAYAIHRGYVPPDRIVLLAFNKHAAEELKERVAKSFERLGMHELSVEASTFHALGLRIIGKATGKKPDIPDWAIDAASGLRKLAELIDQLKDSSLSFRAQWDLFRFVYARDLPKFGLSGSADVWDEQGNGLILTADGTRVRSQEEAMIANWLFYNGVSYLYEGAYEFETADATHRQYRPDFYYPDIELYHEHFALDAQGNAPPHFRDYVSGVEWKRKLHAERGTSFIETTSHQIRSGKVFEHLAAELTKRGVELDPNPNRIIPEGGQKPMPSEELIGLIRVFISHTKSNSLTTSTLRERLDAMPGDTFKLRYRMFLGIVSPILNAWDAALAAEGGIDFEDMLNLAAEYLENKQVEETYELVMADEFQDASRARARLCRALVQSSGRFFFAVGDDWQSINRFAGADVSVMTGFQDWFGHGQLLKLEQTFRCPQELCDISSRFVSKNPAQIRKAVRSVKPAVGPVLQALQVDSKEKLADAISRYVEQLADGVRNGTIKPKENGKVSVYVLGRYNADRQYVPTRKSRFERYVDVSFLTIHRSKGSEADYIILPEMVSASRGRSFPNNRADDPVLALAMPAGDDYPESEERRLFYVALTRARCSVVLFTVRGQCSTFLRELEAEGAVTITTVDGKAVQEESCPSCKQGALIMRTGRYGDFRSCSNFPVCRYKPMRNRSFIIS
ncbi:UvrD-helicase domain-containing protein [Rhizobium sp. P007]|uniref:UvrD-helicase domain-containing protein n=1 Tax=Rhizobium sp. P007 TaxID=285908 RepID=UPI0011583CE4|nr:UvrD-helicase domain-containing protein [Rhizobium sp. P007]CAD7058575.1 helicase IV [Rhizobium sp. P007]